MTTPIRYGPLWIIALRILVALFAAAAILNMIQMHIIFFTTHAADLSGPAFLYIQVRKLWQEGSRSFLSRTIGRTPERAAAAFFGASVITEISQIYFPHGIFSGRFDPLDIGAYAVGVGTCYLLEKIGAGMTPSEPA